MNKLSKIEKIFYISFFPFFLLIMNFIYGKTFVFYLDSPSLITAFLSNYTHFNLELCLRNIRIYLISIILIIYICKDRTEFHLNMFFIFIILPSFYNLFELKFCSHVSSSCGFSCICASIYGLILFYLFYNTIYCIDEININNKYKYIINMLFLISVIYMFVPPYDLSVGYKINKIMHVVGLVCGILIGMIIKMYFLKISKNLSNNNTFITPIKL